MRDLEAVLTRHTIALDDLAHSLPGACDIQSGATSMHVSVSDIKEKLASLAEEKRSAELGVGLKDLHSEIAERIAGTESYQRVADSTSRGKLKDILSRREFQNSASDDAMKRLKEQLMQWAIKLLSGIVKRGDDAVLVVEILVYALCALVLALILIWLWRWFNRNRIYVEPQREFIRFAPSARRWQEWLAEAEAAVRSGDLRQAMHLAYWATISKLESRGSWRPDRARTPREYLRFLPRDSTLTQPLTDLTRRFEVAWYGHRIPTATECADYMAKVVSI